MYLGVKVVMALSFERIHTANLINFGILPLIIKCPEDLEKLAQSEGLEIKALPEQLKKSSDIEVLTDKGEKLTLSHALTEKEVEIVAAGGVMNLFKQEKN